MASTSPLPAPTLPDAACIPCPRLQSPPPLTRLTVHSMRALRPWKRYDIQCRKDMVKVQAACWRELLQLFKHKVDSWKERLFGKHSSLGTCSDAQHTLAQALRRARKHVVGKVRSSTSGGKVRAVDALLRVGQEHHPFTQGLLQQALPQPHELANSQGGDILWLLRARWLTTGAILTETLRSDTGASLLNPHSNSQKYSRSQPLHMGFNCLL